MLLSLIAVGSLGLGLGVWEFGVTPSGFGVVIVSFVGLWFCGGMGKSVERETYTGLPARSKVKPSIPLGVSLLDNVARFVFSFVITSLPLDRAPRTDLYFLWF